MLKLNHIFLIEKNLKELQITRKRTDKFQRTLDFQKFADDTMKRKSMTSRSIEIRNNVYQSMS